MNLKWYSFEESYLISIDYRQLEGLLIVDIDARMSIDHPRVNEVKNMEDYFEKIKLVFEGVQYYKAITSNHILTDPNEDIGSIESIQISSNLNRNDIIVDQQGDRLQLSMNFTDDKATIFSNSIGIRFLEFISEKIAFQVGFERISIKELE